MNYYDSITVRTVEKDNGETDVFVVMKVGEHTEPWLLSEEEAQGLRDGLNVALGEAPPELV